MLKLNRKRSGFSLVELVIVIVILGIIAAVAIPRITSGSRNAGESALRANVQTLRNAIDWYYAEHGNTFPAAKGDGDGNNADSEGAFVSQLTKYSKADGTISATPDAAFPFGPYIRGNLPKLTVGTNIGKNTVEMKNQAADLAVNVAGGTGWIYNVATGQIMPNADDAANGGGTYDTF